MVRQAHHERDQHLTVRPELVEGLVQSSYSKHACQSNWLTLYDNDRNSMCNLLEASVAGKVATKALLTTIR